MLTEILKSKNSWRQSCLATDTYKISMAMGGRPEETEVFYLSYRSGDPIRISVDLEQAVYDCIPYPVNIEKECEWLKSKGFPVDPSVLYTATDISRLEILYHIPQGEIVCPREPILTLRGPQALISWIEPLLIGRISYQMQVANACNTGDWNTFMSRISKVTCQTQKKLTLEAIEDLLRDEDIDYIEERIQVDEEGYYDVVRYYAQKLLDTGVDPSRIFEVGLRAASCMEQHLIALKALKDCGFTKTSNTYGAYVLDMIPVGTLGHEGIMRWGCDDRLAFEKHIAVLPTVTMLLDTNDTVKIGIPTAIDLMKKYPNRMDNVRPDSGDLAKQFEIYVQSLKNAGLPTHPWVFEDGLDDTSVMRYEKLREFLHYPADKVLYGLGGYFIERPEPTGFRRGNISMIYKLSWSEYGPCMKFGDEIEDGESGKRSIPGIPVLMVDEDPSVLGTVIGQYDCIPEGKRLYGVGDTIQRTICDRPILDEVTEQLIEDCTNEKSSKLSNHW